MLHSVTVPKKSPSAQKTKRSTSFDPEVADAVGGVIRRFREASGLAQDVVPVVAQVDRSYYGKLERGERQPTISVLLRVAAALGTTAAELMGQAELILSKKRRPRLMTIATANAALEAAKKEVAARRALAAKRAAAKRVATRKPAAKKVAKAARKVAE